MCRSRCGTINTIVNDRLISVVANPGHPTGGAVCPKGRAAPEIAHSSRRLQRPLRRTRPKGDADPGWEEISWDEALDEIGTRLNNIKRESGAEAVTFALSSPSGTALSDSFEWLLRFVRLFGSPNICDAMEICNWQKDSAHKFTFGYAMPTPEFSKSDLILLWGYNPANSWLAHSGEIAKAQANGAKIIVIDPHRTGHALQSDWVRLRPGTDGVLALGIARLLIESGSYNLDFVRKWTNAPLLVDVATGRFVRGRDIGMAERPDCHVVWDTRHAAPYPYYPEQTLSDEDSTHVALRGVFELPAGVHGETVHAQPAFELYAQACEPYSLERVADITGADVDALVSMVDAIATAKRVSYHGWTGIAQHANATQTERAIALLYALTGCFDAEGGNVRLNRQPINPISDLSSLDETQRLKALGLTARPLGPPEIGEVTASDVYTAILDKKPYPIRAFIAFGSNILASRPEPGRGKLALEALEFHVHVDMFMTPSAQFADIVLPANSPWEREALRVGFEISAEAEARVQLRRQMVPSQGESRSDLWIVFQLAQRVGLKAQFFGGNIEAAWDHTLAPLGLTTAQLRASPDGVTRPVGQRYRKYEVDGPTGIEGFPTPTKRVEIYSEQLATNGYAAVPVFLDASHTAITEDPLPYVVTNARRGYYIHSQHRSITSLRRRAPEPVAEISAQLARDKKLHDGDWVTLFNETGRARFKVRVDEALLPDVIVADYGWWQPNHDLGLPGYRILGEGNSNLNVLTPAAQTDPVSGAVSLRSTRCDVRTDSEWPQAASKDEARAMKVMEVIFETDDTVSVLLAPEDDAPLPDFLPGQHLTVECEVPGYFMGTVTRSYSLSSSALDRSRNAYRITVKRVTAQDGLGGEVAGLMSTHFNVTLRRGNVVSVVGPRGVFCLPTAPDFPVVMIAAGVGITPFMSWLETIASFSHRPAGALYYGNRDGTGHVFRQRLAELKVQIPEIEFVDYYSKPQTEDRVQAAFDAQGRITADSIAQYWIDHRARFYLCGSEAMMREITDGLIARGVPRFEIFSEKFFAPAVSLPTTEGVTHRVHFARSNRSAEWTPSCGTVMDLAERLGVKISTGCRVGQCESCAIGIVSGNVAHRVASDAFDDDACVSCQAVPITDLVLDA